MLVGPGMIVQLQAGGLQVVQAGRSQVDAVLTSKDYSFQVEENLIMLCCVNSTERGEVIHRIVL